MTRRTQAGVVQQPVGQLPEPLQANLPSIEQIERELQGGDA
jgi:hypothetical protein